MKKITITIPDEFESHFKNDKFKDSMGRMIFDLKNRPADITNLAGRYEIETLEMLETALEESTEIRTGKWMLGNHNRNIVCSKCGTWFGTDRIRFMKSCPNCKADMENCEELYRYLWDQDARFASSDN